MTGDCHVRFCEGLGVKFPGPTQLVSREQPSMRLFVTVREMEERPSGVGFQDQASNCLTLLWSKATVVNV